MSPSLGLMSTTHDSVEKQPKTENNTHLNLDRIKKLKGNLTLFHPNG